jgi:small-conductance mechanosensitive channel
VLLKILPVTALLCLLCVAPGSAQTPNGQTPNGTGTSPVTTSAVTPEQASRALETLQDDSKRAQLIETLRTIANATPAPATPAPEHKPAIPLAANSLVANSLGAQLLQSISEQIGETSRDVADGVRTVTRFRGLWHWLQRTASDPANRDMLLGIAWKLALVFGCALGVEWLLGLALRRPLASLQARTPAVPPAPAAASAASSAWMASLVTNPAARRRWLGLNRLWQALLRLPLALGRLLLELMPVVAFVATAVLLLGTVTTDLATTRPAILAFVTAYAACRGFVGLARSLVCPPGLFTVRAETAAYVESWTRRLAIVGAFGLAGADVALLFGLRHGGYAALLRLVMLLVHVLVVVIILQCRRPVAQAIRAAEDSRGTISLLRDRFAATWHLLAIAVVLALWAVWALNVPNGYSLLLRYFVGTIVVVLVGRLVSVMALGLIDRGFRFNEDLTQRFPGLETRANRYVPLLRRIIANIITAAGIVALFQVWGVDVVAWFHSGQIGNRLVSAAFTIGVALLVAAVAWEGCNALMDRQIAHLTRERHFARAARLRTFQPMLRTALLCVVIAVVALTALSEIGVNVAPLLAGAGIVGIAVGFGSQKLVQDLITGLFLLLENVVQVGDAVTVSGLSGTVENLSIRTIRLRAGDGSVHIVPFSAVTSVTNASRGMGNAAVSVNVSYREDTDRVGAILQEIVAEMRSENEYGGLIRGDLELWGVDKVDGAMASIVGQIPCTADGRWPVQREFNRRMKQRFQQYGIEIANAGQTIWVHAPMAEEVGAEPARRRARG